MEFHERHKPKIFKKTFLLWAQMQLPHLNIQNPNHGLPITSMHNHLPSNATNSRLHLAYIKKFKGACPTTILQKHIDNFIVKITL